MHVEFGLYWENFLKPTYLSLTQSLAYRSCLMLDDIVALHINARLSIKG